VIFSGARKQPTLTTIKAVLNHRDAEKNQREEIVRQPEQRSLWRRISQKDQPAR